MSQRRLKLAVVTPLANEAETIDAWLERVVAQLDSGDRVFCVVDRASRDDTQACVQAWTKRDARVQLVWAPENTCVVDAYFRGYREALAWGADWILEMDGGFSHSPEEIPRFVAAMTSGADFAAGSRFAPGGDYRGRGKRFWVSRGGSVLTNLLLGTRMRDMTSGFECFTNAALTHVLEHGTRARAHFFQTEIRYLLRDWRWVEVPISYGNPSARLGMSSINEALRCLWALYRMGSK